MANFCLYVCALLVLNSKIGYAMEFPESFNFHYDPEQERRYLRIRETDPEDAAAALFADTRAATCDANYEKEKEKCTKEYQRPETQEVVTDMIHWQNRWMLQKYIEFAVDPVHRVDLTPVAGFLFLNVSVSIYKRLCNSYFVPHTFLTAVEFLFRELSYAVTKAAPRTELISVKDTDRTVAILMTCLNNTAGKNYTADECGELIHGVCPNIETDFNADIYDPLLDVIWHIYEAVHSHCFHYTHNDNRMWNIFGYGFTDLFVKEIQIRWPRKKETKEEYWERLLGPDYRLIGANIERCNADVVKNSELPYRMPRDMMPNEIRLDGHQGIRHKK